MSMTDTITIRSHSSSNSHVLRKNNRQGNSRKTIKPYKRSSTRPGLAASQARTPVTKDTSSYQLEATLRGVNSKLTESPIARRHRVLSFVSQSNCETDCKVFQNITRADYDYIFCKIEDCPARPRLEYNCDTHTLVIEMPSPIHEAIIKVISKSLEHLDLVLQDFIAEELLSSDTHTNLTVDGDTVKCIPDILHMVATLTDPPIVINPVMGEVAVSQPRADLLQRLRDRLKEFRGIVLLFIAEVQERIHYTSPTESSQAWIKLQKKKLLTSDAFLSDRTGPRSLKNPWTLWLKSTPGMRWKELFPNKSMDKVTRMIERGLSRMRDKYAELARKASPNVDVSALLEAHVTLPFTWDTMLSKLAFASMAMAYSRYKCWYMGSRGTKHTVDEAFDAEVTGKRTVDEAFDSGPARNTHSLTRAHTDALARSRSVP
ncbi:hypothetical protein CY34DRAFT_16558 [Suillus luteus UH-Slu-Lm8-n1]|uniref:Uncharacterized protein n=1 Tax=Suillus luteus UH-Slu-Lm8-n1 TaxID=930992 RepID=A0A0D0AP98_9AGAM|nr:hypothetical protein CY34DRAFT_16558 [Suillus luteus UH-Slu-Lm8-n1]